MNFYCVFNIGDRRVGLKMSNVREIVERNMIDLTPVPMVPGFVKGLFNLRGQVLPFMDIASFVGGKSEYTGLGDRAVVVERGDFRFATNGERIQTVEAEESTFTPLQESALYPALDSQANTERGEFQVLHLDRLEACVNQAIKFPSFALNGGPRQAAQS
jgi:chemotaxis signal transduction protein